MTVNLNYFFNLQRRAYVKLKPVYQYITFNNCFLQNDIALKKMINDPTRYLRLWLQFLRYRVCDRWTFSRFYGKLVSLYVEALTFLWMSAKTTYISELDLPRRTCKYL